MKNLICWIAHRAQVAGKYTVIGLAALSVASCVASKHTRGHLGRTKFSPVEDRAGFYGKELCHAAGYHCVQIHNGDTWKKLFPDAKERELVMRLNRINMPVHSRQWIVVPDNLKQITYNDLSPLPLQCKTNGKKRLLINLKQHAFAAYDEQGKMLHWGPISAGSKHALNAADGYETVVGGFKIFRIHGEEYKSGKYPIETKGGAPMPYGMFFHGGWAIHGSTLPGRHASHGCVRLFYEDAMWLNKMFVERGTNVDVQHG